MSVSSKPKLQLKHLHERHSGLTQPLAAALAEAAAVCLARHHEPPCDVQIACSKGISTRLVDFDSPDVRTRNAWANETDATENGAYGLSLAAIEAEEDMVAVRRAETLTGADWYVAPIGAPVEDLERCFRLEVSGVDAGGSRALAARLRQKVDQTRRGKSNLPAFAAVVGFREKLIAIQKVSPGE